MTISNCEFMPARTDFQLCTFLVTIDGVLKIEGAIDDSFDKMHSLHVVLGDAYFVDSYYKECFNNEIMERYMRWDQENDCTEDIKFEPYYGEDDEWL